MDDGLLKNRRKQAPHLRHIGKGLPNHNKGTNPYIVLPIYQACSSLYIIAIFIITTINLQKFELFLGEKLSN